MQLETVSELQELPCLCLPEQDLMVFAEFPSDDSCIKSGHAGAAVRAGRKISERSIGDVDAGSPQPISVSRSMRELEAAC